MATAQVLKVTHRVEDGVNTVGERVQGVDVRVKGVDDKIDVAIGGALSTLATYRCHPKPIYV
jgi:hypothetical protein